MFSKVASVISIADAYASKVKASLIRQINESLKDTMKKILLRLTSFAVMGLSMTQVHAEEVPFLKNSAILGSLLSYGFAAMNKDNFQACTPNRKASIQTGSDEELSSVSLGFSVSDCALKPAAQPMGLQFVISPTVIASGWSSNSGPGARSLTELTLVPKVQYVLPYGSLRWDVTVGVGISLLSKSSVGSRIKSTNFQFSDEIGFGVSDAADKLRIGFTYRHISNLGISVPNNGVDFRGLTLTYKL